ncbi:MAG: GNAT family N-acetyltransferase [Clostridiales bacterium]|nr:GNAT family N-acetyltransferase [Clostridiales bacterium]
MNIREAASQDALLISRLIAQSWRGAYQDILDPAYLSRLPEEYWLPTMRSWLESGRMYGFIAEEDGAPIGCVIYGRGRDEDHADWGEIASLYVLPERMRHGVGTSLLETALAALQAEGFDRVYLWAIAEYTRGLRFYQHHGFRATGERVSYKLGSGDVTDVRLIKGA